MADTEEPALLKEEDDDAEEAAVDLRDITELIQPSTKRCPTASIVPALGPLTTMTVARGSIVSDPSPAGTMVCLIGPQTPREVPLPKLRVLNAPFCPRYIDADSGSTISSLEMFAGDAATLHATLAHQAIPDLGIVHPSHTGNPYSRLYSLPENICININADAILRIDRLTISPAQWVEVVRSFSLYVDFPPVGYSSGLLREAQSDRIGVNTQGAFCNYEELIVLSPRLAEAINAALNDDGTHTAAYAANMVTVRNIILGNTTEATLARIEFSDAGEISVPVPQFKPAVRIMSSRPARVETSSALTSFQASDPMSLIAAIISGATIELRIPSTTEGSHPSVVFAGALLDLLYGRGGYYVTGHQGYDPAAMLGLLTPATLTPPVLNTLRAFVVAVAAANVVRPVNNIGNLLTYMVVEPCAHGGDVLTPLNIGAGAVTTVAGLRALLQGATVPGAPGVALAAFGATLGLRFSFAHIMYAVLQIRRREGPLRFFMPDHRFVASTSAVIGMFSDIVLDDSMYEPLLPTPPPLMEFVERLHAEDHCAISFSLGTAMCGYGGRTVNNFAQNILRHVANPAIVTPINREPNDGVDYVLDCVARAGASSDPFGRRVVHDESVKSSFAASIKFWKDNEGVYELLRPRSYNVAVTHPVLAVDPFLPFGGAGVVPLATSLTEAYFRDAITGYFPTQRATGATLHYGKIDVVTSTYSKQGAIVPRRSTPGNVIVNLNLDDLLSYGDMPLGEILETLWQNHSGSGRAGQSVVLRLNARVEYSLDESSLDRTLRAHGIFRPLMAAPVRQELAIRVPIMMSAEGYPPSRGCFSYYTIDLFRLLRTTHPMVQVPAPVGGLPAGPPQIVVPTALADDQPAILQRGVQRYTDVRPYYDLGRPADPFLARFLRPNLPVYLTVPFNSAVLGLFGGAQWERRRGRNPVSLIAKGSKLRPVPGKMLTQSIEVEPTFASFHYAIERFGADQRALMEFILVQVGVFPYAIARKWNEVKTNPTYGL